MNQIYVGPSHFEAAAPIKMQRAEGHARVTFRQRAEATRLATLFQEGCAKIRLPKPLGGAAPEAILINTAGGLTGGDKWATEIELSAGSSTVVSTQACERIYRSTGADAQMQNRLNVREGAKLAWLPQETILFDGGKLSRKLDVDLEGDAELLAVEAVLFGRKAMGEVLRSGVLHDRWRVRRDGKLIFVDDLRVSGDISAQFARPAIAGGGCAMATVLFACREPGRLLEPAREIIGADGGASAWGGKLVVRLVAETGLNLRCRLEPLLSLFLSHMLAGQPLPKVWRL